MSDDVRLEIALDGGRSSYLPRDEVRGVARWSLPGPPRMLEVRLFWSTEGRGDRDVEVVASELIERPQRQGEQGFTFRLPAGPYSCSGQLVSVLWTVELVDLDRDLAGSAGLVMGPGGREVHIDAGDGAVT
jgi:hypothetical protein